MEIYALQVNHLSNPLGYELGKGKLSFSWKVKEAERKGTKVCKAAHCGR